jgi:excisionase family DNA binding protein
MNLELYCSTAEAAATLGVSEKYVRVLLAKGLLQGDKVGHAWLVRRDSLRGFVKIGRGPASKPPAPGRPAQKAAKRRRK